MRSTSITVALGVLACALASAAGVRREASVNSAGAVRAESETVQPVAGSGTHFVTTAIVHSTEPTPTGMVQRSTETVDLTGDLTGRILYQPVSVVDFANGTLTNTGHQIFSGTVLGSAPVMLHDDEFRFDVNLITGAATGKVYLTDNIAGPKIRCELDIVATGKTAEGNITASTRGPARSRTTSALPAPGKWRRRWCQRRTPGHHYIALTRDVDRLERRAM